MKKNKLILNLFIYVIIFSIIVFIVGNCLKYFYDNLINIQTSLMENSDVSNINLYFLNFTNKNNTVIKNFGQLEDELSYFITFQAEDGTVGTFVKRGDKIYFNQIKICENVDKFKIVVDKSEKESLSVELEINKQAINLQYVLN